MIELTTKFKIENTTILNFRIRMANKWKQLRSLDSTWLVTFL